VEASPRSSSTPNPFNHMQEVKTSLIVAVVIALGFTIFYYFDPITPNFKIKPTLLSQEDYLKEKEKILIDKIMRK
jgi:hypothetical protein